MTSSPSGLEPFSLELRPMTEASYVRFLARTIPEYAAEKVRSGQWGAEEAEARAEGEYRLLLPLGPSTPDNVLYDLHDPLVAADVGVLWYALRDEGTGRMAFVYEVEIFPEFRRHGYATQAFALLEHDAARRGAGSIQLHVFGHNHAARALYQGLGFAETNVMMRKEL